jgi:hypothetical protein
MFQKDNGADPVYKGPSVHEYAAEVAAEVADVAGTVTCSVTI